MKKKICALLLLGSCLFSISACGNKAASNAINNVQYSSQIEETLESRDTEEIKDNTGDKAEKTIGSEELNEVVSTDVENTISAIESESEKLVTDAVTDAASENAESKETDANKELVDGMRPEFKEAMDSYEAFYDEYCDIIKKYAENPSDMKLLVDYTNMLAKAAEMTEKFDAWENSDMNNAELKYYLDVNNRITQKLLEVSQ